ncbi:hypothetical protein N7462_002250 [Penicillium macrosclerotiorum]|uniref:uncharacterized protein n=1 Tax=Penicillium macrosclerotiorum TaxID=303699 RepID=UPI002547B9E7|nr:uncharacterized protein N7462_002250 [Penicillium macrosclerotiorum]KAJ5692827.1 hypothetical protein N7462_002250 [Penicillium macrosclerotiorum]
MIYEDEAEFQKHSCNEHGVPEAHVGTLSGAARRPALEKILECPFGDDFSAPENADKSNLFLNGALHQHVATHMKQIALLALQKLPHGDEEDCEDVASDAPLDDVRFPELRRSMYSLLDDETLEFEDTVEDGVSNTLEDRIMSSVGRLGLEDRDLEGMTKLHRAVRDNEFMVVQSLIEQGANLRSTSNDGRTVLHYASIDRSKGVEMIKLLLNSNAQEALGLVDEDGQTPLHYAAKAGFADAADLLIASGLSADSLDRFGFSPFIWAVIVGDITATRLFLSHGSNANSTSSDGKSALSWAASLGHTLIVELILEMRAEVMSATTKARLIPLEEAAAYGDVRTVQFLLHFGADPNYRDRDGWSAIHWAAEQGHRDVLLLLFEHGADIHAVSAYGTSVLHCAANGGHSDIVTELLQHGADPNKSTCHGWTPLHHAAFMGHSRVVRALLESNRITSSPAQDNHGWSALHLATHRRQLDTVIALLENSDIQKAYAQCDESGLTAEEWLDLEFESHSYKTIRELAFDKSRCCRAVTKLRQAIRDNHIVLAQVFLNQGCDINGTDSGNRTALYYSATAGDLSTVDMLLQCGADPNIIPDGYRSWEEFISDDTIMQRLRRAGHQGMTFDPEIDYQIRFALLKRGRNHALSQQPSRLSLQPASRSRLRDIFWGRRKSTTPEKKTGTEK